MTDTPEIDWQVTLVPPTLDLHGAIVALDRVALQILMVTDADRRLSGTLTDGDIRRALLKAQPLTTPITEATHLTPMVVDPDLSRESVLILIHVNKMRQLPILGPEGRILGLHLSVGSGGGHGPRSAPPWWC